MRACAACQRIGGEVGWFSGMLSASFAFHDAGLYWTEGRMAGWPLPLIFADTEQQPEDEVKG